jgi:alkylation response protein AidB-like acyl-CoA dehydrogenase
VVVLTARFASGQRRTPIALVTPSPDNEELLLLRDSARALFSRAGGLSRARTIRTTSPAFDHKVWLELATAGLVGATLPESAGGLGLGLTAAGIIAEEAGRLLAPEPLTSVAILAGGVLRRLHTPLAATLTQRLTAGELIPILAWQDNEAHHHPTHVSTRIACGRVGGGKSFIPHGDAADGFVVSTVDPDGSVLLCWIEASAPGVTLQERRQTDGSYLCRLLLSQVNVAESNILGGGAKAAQALAAAVDDATMLAAAELVGVMSAALDITVEYLRTRTQFDRPIGAFQALQHRAVDMMIHREIAKAAVDDLLRAIDASAGPHARSLLASRAKARAGKAALLICRESIQMHGAIGFTDEADIGLFLKRALVLDAFLGNAAHHRRRYAALKQRT